MIALLAHLNMATSNNRALTPSISLRGFYAPDARLERRFLLPIQIWQGIFEPVGFMNHWLNADAL